MARNKYPEETVKRILDVAQELFMTKGYEHTTMQDIVDNLGGLTKGAIYHHFKSKEEILEAVFDRVNQPVLDRIEEAAADRSLTGLEKIRAFNSASAASDTPDVWRAMRPAPDPVQNARILAMEYADVMDTARRYLEPALRQGMADGSTPVQCPRETAEVMLLLANLWMVPLFHPVADEDEYHRRVQVFLRVVRALGVDLMGDAPAEELRAWGDTWKYVNGAPDSAAGTAAASGAAGEKCGDDDAASRHAAGEKHGDVTAGVAVPDTDASVAGGALQ